MYHVNGRSTRGIESLLATKIPVICAPMYRPEIPKKLRRPLGNFEYAAVDDHTKEITIDVLIGLDNHLKCVKLGVKALTDGLVAQESVFGCIISGTVEAKASPSSVNLSHQLLCLNDMADSMLRTFWELESIGICDGEVSITDSVMQEFHNSVCVAFVRKALQVPKVECRCWADSMVALAWNKEDPSKWKAFVGNCVSEIQQLASPAQWYHCPGKCNQSEIWLHGPEWVVGADQRSEPFDVGLDASRNDIQDEKSCGTTLLVTNSGPVKMLETERWGSFEKSIRLVELVLRCIHNIRKSAAERQTDDLSQGELSIAKERLFLCVQEEHYANELVALRQSRPVPRNSPVARLSLMLGSDGLLMVQGRLQMAQLAFEEKYPIILPKCHLSFLLLRFHHRLLKHAGVSTMVVSVRNHYTGLLACGGWLNRQSESAFHVRSSEMPLFLYLKEFLIFQHPPKLKTKHHRSIHNTDPVSDSVHRSQPPA